MNRQGHEIPRVNTPLFGTHESLQSLTKRFQDSDKQILEYNLEKLRSALKWKCTAFEECGNIIKTSVHAFKRQKINWASAELQEVIPQAVPNWGREGKKEKKVVPVGIFRYLLVFKKHTQRSAFISLSCQKKIR